MNTQSASLSELNALVEKLLRNWMAIIALEGELILCYEDDDAELACNEIIGYRASWSHMPRFGHVIIRNDGITEKFLDYETIDCFVIITAPLKIKLPNFLHDIFQKHYASEMFEAELDYIGLVAVMHFDCVDLYSIISYLSDAAKQVRLDAFTETMLRPNAEALIAELTPYMAWFDYAAVIAEQVYNDTRHEQLIADMNLLLSYLSQGGELDFAKMTSLCDVTGSLQPVRNLILSKMPELTA